MLVNFVFLSLTLRAQRIQIQSFEQNVEIARNVGGHLLQGALIEPDGNRNPMISYLLTSFLTSSSFDRSQGYGNAFVEYFSCYNLAMLK